MLMNDFECVSVCTFSGVVSSCIRTNPSICWWTIVRWSATAVHSVRSTNVRKTTMDSCTWSMHHRTHSVAESVSLSSESDRWPSKVVRMTPDWSEGLKFASFRRLLNFCETVTVFVWMSECASGNFNGTRQNPNEKWTSNSTANLSQDLLLCFYWLFQCSEAA